MNIDITTYKKNLIEVIKPIKHFEQHSYKSIIIEGILLRLPYPIVVITNNDKIVIGNDYLNTVAAFINNKFALNNLKHYKQFNNKFFKDLKGIYKRRIIESVQKVHILHNPSEETFKFIQKYYTNILK